jgi:hypothetical protein
MSFAHDSAGDGLAAAKGGGQPVTTVIAWEIYAAASLLISSRLRSMPQA